MSWKILENFITHNGKKLNDCPIFLWGESMGGAIVTEMMMNQPYFAPEIYGIILSGPMIEIIDQPNVVLKGLLSFSTLFFNFDVTPTKYGGELGSSSIKSQRDYMFKHEEHYNGGLPNTTAIQLFNLAENIKSEIKNKKLNVPMLIQHGEEDFVCGINGSKLLISENQNKDKTLCIYKGRHMISHDVDILKVLEDLNSWIQIRIEPYCHKCHKKENEKDVTITSFGCRHYICTTCMTEYIDDQVLNQKKSFISLKCPNFEKKRVCIKVLSYDSFKKYASDKAMKIHDNIVQHIPTRKLKDENDEYELKDFNYYFDKNMELRSLLTDEKFIFINEKYYDAMGSVIEKYIQNTLVKNYKFEEVFLDEKKFSNIFLSEDFYKNDEKLMVIIQGVIIN
jgi:esterase/lipase